MVRLVAYVNSQSSDGRNVETVSDTFGAWAEVTDLSGGRQATEQTKFTEQKRFLVRFRFDKYPNVNWKVDYMGREWTINSMKRVDEKRFYWVIVANV